MNRMTLMFALLFGVAVAAHSVPIRAAEWGAEWWDEEDTQMFESDNFGEDDYGTYDEDFDWDAVDDEFVQWFGDVEEDWDEFEAGDSMPDL